jgi:hypothetical protein
LNEKSSQKFPTGHSKTGARVTKAILWRENRVLFDDLVPFSSAPFLKKDFFDSFNGLRYLRVGGRGQNFESKIMFGCRKSPKMAQNPTRQVHPRKMVPIIFAGRNRPAEQLDRLNYTAR